MEATICFGNMKTTQQTDSSQTKTTPSWLTDAAKQNVTAAQNLQNQGFTPYGGQQVAGFDPQQLASFDAANNLSGSINGGEIGSMLDNYSSAGPQSVNASTIASRMSPYMNQYVNLALQPQLEAQRQQFAGQNKSFDSAATGSGAFGDTSWGLGRGNLTQQQNIAGQGLVGNAYNAAFNTAIGAGAQDVANDINAQTTNANFAETALGRQLTGANTKYGMQTGAADLQNKYGAQRTAQDQAGLTARFNQWLMAQQYPFLTSQNLNQTMTAAGGPAGYTINGQSTTQAPDNSGYGLVGAFLGGLADGGTAEAGKPVLVGERGPELMVPNANSVVIPHEVLQAARMLRDNKSGGAAPLQFGIAA